MNPQIYPILEHLQELTKDTDLGKRFKEKTERVIVILQEGAPLAVEKALLELEELNFIEASSYHRTQVWDAMGMLESLKH